MQQLTLTTDPNQQFSVTLENTVYGIVIKETNGVMSATVTRNNVTILSAVRILPFTPIIPYPYLENGNLIMTTLNEELPYYTAFGISQFLYYATIDEMAALRA